MNSTDDSDKQNLITDYIFPNEDLILSDITNIDRLACTHKSYDFFRLNYMKQNKPCIFTPDLTEKWKSRQKWVTPDGEPNLEYLIENFGSSTVPVVVSDDEENGNCNRDEMLFETYIKQYMQVNENKTSQEKYFYLKDWHFNRAYPDYNAYVVPKYFADDWLNEFCKIEKDDFQFVYIGPKGTWTPLHADVFGSYSWSANICGRKRWLLFPPGQEKLLQNNSSKLPYMLKSNEMLNYDNISHLDIIQETGETIFVPSGWYHQVWNIENTISINHNWFNGYNILYIWDLLNNASKEVEQELADIKGCDDWWNEHQFLLKAHHGMDLHEFFKILEYIYLSKYNSPITTAESCERIIFDLTALENISKIMLSVSLPEDLSKNVSILNTKIINSLSHYKAQKIS